MRFAAPCWRIEMTKQEMRAALKEKRNALPKKQKKEADRAISERIAASAIFAEASAVLLYAPIGSELNLLPLVRRCRELGKTVAFPRCNVEEKTMQFYILTPESRLEKGAYGIRLENDFLVSENGAEDLFEDLLPLDLKEYILR